MKKLLVLIFASFFLNCVGAQTTPRAELSYKVRRGTLQLYYGDLKISYSKAKEMSLDNGFNKAFEEFKKAKRIRNWDIVWYSYGSYCLVRGATTGNLITMSTGVVIYLIPLFPNRGKRFVLYTKNAVEAFNSGE